MEPDRAHSWTLDPRRINLPLVYVVGLIIAIVSAAAWVDSRVAHHTRHGWTIQDASVWTERLEQRNPTLDVPSADEVWQHNRRHDLPSRLLHRDTPWTRQEPLVVDPKRWEYLP